MFRPGFNLSSLLPESCTNTSSPLLAIPADSSGGWLALNLVNGGAVSKLSVSLDGHSMYVYAADGLFVSMQEVQVSKPVILAAGHHRLRRSGSIHRGRAAVLGHD